MARRRWEKETPEERTANAKHATRKRWKRNPAAMLEHMREMARRPRPGARKQRVARCPCGKYTVTAAARHGHQCGTPAPRHPEPEEVNQTAMDICDFCKRPIADDEITFTDDEGHVMHFDCSELKEQESEDYLEKDSD